MFKTVLQNLLKWFLWSLMECYLQLRHCYLHLHVIYFHFVLTPDRLLFTKIVQEGCIFGVLDPVKRYVSMCVWSICAKLLIYLVWYLIFFCGPSNLDVQVYFESDEVQAAIVTCGGLCPGLNTVIRELVCGLHHMYGVKRVLGIEVRGYFWHCNFLS